MLNTASTTVKSTILSPVTSALLTSRTVTNTDFPSTDTTVVPASTTSYAVANTTFLTTSASNSSALTG